MRYSYYILHKPCNFLSQFTREIPSHHTLADLMTVPKDVYPLGRLDKDSEGLLLLTNNPKVNKLILHPDYSHTKVYYAQVEGLVTEFALESLKNGPTIKIKHKMHQCLPCEAELAPKVCFPDRVPPIRYRKNIPTSWIKITLTEGKNRQVRKMCAHVGFPVLRLIRTQIEKIELDILPCGDYHEISEKAFINALRLPHNL